MQLVCPRSRPSVPQPGDEAPAQPQSFEELIERAYNLAEAILKNKATYNCIKQDYLNEEASVSDLLERVEVLEDLRKNQAKERKKIKEDFSKLDPREGIDPKIEQFRKLINTHDDLDKMDEQLPKMKLWTFDYFDVCGKEGLSDPCERCIFFTIFWLFCCPCSAICNRSCSGLKGRVEQLKYAIREE